MQHLKTPAAMRAFSFPDILLFVILPGCEQYALLSGVQYSLQRADRLFRKWVELVLLV
jgi:hypothetical protein